MSLTTPPNERLIRDAEREEARLLSLMFKEPNCVADAVRSGIQHDWLWTADYAEIYAAIARYWSAHKALITYDTFNSIMHKVAKEPETITRKVDLYHKLFAIHVRPDDYPLLKNQVIARHAQRQAYTVLDRHYQAVMNATNDQLGIVERLRADVDEATRPVAGDFILRRLDEFALGADNGGCLLGDRLLCRGDDWLLVSNAGAGKSVLVMQMTACYALGRPFLGIAPVGPLRVLIVQAENSDGDLAEQRDKVHEFLGLTDEERRTVADQVRVVSEPAVSGGDFINLLDRLLTAWTADLVIVDPLFGFLGGDVKEQAEVSRFIRNGIKPLLRRHRCGHVMVHHTNKPVGNAKMRLEGLDLLYAYAGSAELANAYRAVTILHRTDKERRRYAFYIAKRGSRSGIRNGAGGPVDRVDIQWASGGRWGWEVMADSGLKVVDQPAGPPAAEVKPRGPEDLLAAMPLDRIMTRDWVLATAKERFAIGRNRADGWLALLTGDGRLQEVEVLKHGSGRRKMGYVRPSDEFFPDDRERPSREKPGKNSNNDHPPQNPNETEFLPEFLPGKTREELVSPGQPVSPTGNGGREK